MPLTIKIPVRTIREDKTRQVIDRIERLLKDDPDNAYTIMGIMVEEFGVRERDILGKSFADWPAGMPQLYLKIQNALKFLKGEGKANSVKKGKAYVYWWESDNTNKPADSSRRRQRRVV